MNKRTAGQHKSRAHARAATTTDKKTSGRKLASNRENAKRSTGPRTERGKSYSRLNALKHGILASVAVSELLEGRTERDLFDQMVDGLARELKPVGWREELLVQDIANSYWSRRKLIQYEQDLAFKRHQDIIAKDQDVDGSNAAANAMSVANLLRPIPIQPQYMFARYDDEPMIGSGGEARATAGLEIPTLPHPAELAIVTRYRAMLNRERERLMRELEQVQAKRRGGDGEQACGDIEPARRGIDRGAGYRNLHRNCYVLPMAATLDIHNMHMKELAEYVKGKVAPRKRKKHQRHEPEPEPDQEIAGEEDAGGEVQDGDAAANLENYQTKPKTPRETDTSSPPPSQSEPDEGAPDGPGSSTDPASGG